LAINPVLGLTQYMCIPLARGWRDRAFHSGSE
jgi:hypothetical protein